MSYLPALAPHTDPDHANIECPYESAPDPDIITRDPQFYSDHIVFQVGKRLFKVPRRKFERDSEVFGDMFALPSASDGVVDGLSDEHPLVLEAIQVEEFRAFLRVMFRPHYGPTWEEAKSLTLNEWIHVLKLTHMWNFEKLRGAAIENLTPLLQSKDPVRWLVLARTYEVHEWLFPALHALARRTKPLKVDEVDQLGIVTVIKMAEVRESYTGGTGTGTYNRLHLAISLGLRVRNKTGVPG